MMQRGMIWQNQQIGAFEGEEYYGGRANPYQKYYAAMQARQAEFQRARFLNAQRFQNNYMLQQQKAQDIQFAADQEVARTRQERERKLAAIRKQQDAIKNNPEVDQNSFEVQNMLKQLDAAAFQAETDLELNPVDIQKIPSGNVDKNNNPIETWIVYENGKPVVIRNGDKVAAQQLAEAKQKQDEIDAAKKFNLDSERLTLDKKKAETDRATLLETRKQNELKASGADVDPEAEMMKGFGQKAHDELMAPRKADAREALKGLYDRDHGEGEWSLLDKEDKDAKVEEFINDPSFVGPSKEELRNKAKQLYDRTQPIPEDEYGDEAMYESPMDPGMEPEFSDEQFAGTEPAGLYDPTGQPLPMDGGMYNGLA
tara:strand:- start:992 stop:2101 length:1110 start_codon:yes stop_codon:yes gene_type:complete